ncbi:MAG: hypothetical protein ACREJ3_00085, partial [Polyangiaceae bacterium]
MMKGRWIGALALLLSAGCSSSAGSNGANVRMDGGAALSDDAGVTGEGGPAAMNIVGQLPNGVTTTLPPLPALTNVTATERDDSVGIDFDPVDGAIDYRVYPLPNDKDVTTNSDG